SNTSVVVARPVPTNVMVWPGLAEALLVSVGVPVCAVLLMAARLALKGALTPPAVFTLIAPNGLARFNVTLRRTLLELLTSGPELPASTITKLPNRYSDAAPS